MTVDDERPGDLDVPPAGTEVHEVTTAGRHRRPDRLGTIGRRLAVFWSDNRRTLTVAAVGTIVLRAITAWIGLVSQFGVNFPHDMAKNPSLLSQVWGHWDAGY